MASNINSHPVAGAADQRTKTVVFSLVMLLIMACNLLISWAIMQADTKQEMKAVEEENVKKGSGKMDVQSVWFKFRIAQ